MREYAKIYQIKNDAKDSLDGKYSGAIGVILVSNLIITTIISWISNIVVGVSTSMMQLSGSEAATLAVSGVVEVILLAANIILNVLNAGVALYFLNMACGQPGTMGDLFAGYRGDNKKVLQISAVLTTAQTVCLLPYQYLINKVQMAMIQGMTQGTQMVDAVMAEKYLLYAAIALGVGLIIYLPFSLAFGLSYFFIWDFPELSAKEVMVLCLKKMKGHKVRLLRLELSFLPLMLLCVLSFGIGFLWLRPYMQMAQTKFYLNLMNPEE